MIFRLMISRRWILTSILVIIVVGVNIQLGIWQLDRLQEKRDFNAHIELIRAMEPLDLSDSSSDDLDQMEYRRIVAEGFFDFENQIAIRNMYNDKEIGYHLLTPLMLNENLAVLVDRGWISAADNQTSQDWELYDETVFSEVTGIIRIGHAEPDMGGRIDPTLEPGQTRLDFWFNIDLERIEEQLPYELMGIYIQLDPEENDNEPPIPYQPEIILSEGNHLGYAVQWFGYGALILFGYPVLIRKRTTENSA